MTKITKEENDPICMRASIGGKPEIGFYLVYRGSRRDVLNMLKQVISDLEVSAEACPEPEAQPHIKRERFGSS